jgi:hypothetical protein
MALSKSWIYCSWEPYATQKKNDQLFWPFDSLHCWAIVSRVNVGDSSVYSGVCAYLQWVLISLGCGGRIPIPTGGPRHVTFVAGCLFDTPCLYLYSTWLCLVHVYRHIRR